MTVSTKVLVGILDFYSENGHNGVGAGRCVQVSVETILGLDDIVT